MILETLILNNKMTADNILTAMLRFAESPECPQEKKIKLINGAYKTWVDLISESNPFAYNKIKHEKINYANGVPLIFKKVIQQRKKVVDKNRVSLYKNGIKFKEFLNKIEAANYLKVTKQMIEVCINIKGRKYDIRKNN